MKRRLFRALCVSLLAMVCLNGNATVYNGNCGAGDGVEPVSTATWSFNSETGELTITGEGALFNFNMSDFEQAPWQNADWTATDVYGNFSTIKSAVVGEGITTIPGDYFNREKALTTVTLPKTIKSIGIDAFAECSSLKTITCNATTPPTLGVTGDEGTLKPELVFYDLIYSEGGDMPAAQVNITKLEKIIVPSTDAVTAYKAADGWKKYSTIIQIADPVVTITAAENLIYNGRAQDLLTSAQTTGGTLMFSLKADATDADYSTSIPQGQDAKEYTIYYKVKGNDNYNDVATRSLNVTISPKTVTSPTVELSPKSFEYDGNEHYPTVKVYDGTTEIPTKEYTISYQIKSSGSGISGSGDSGSGTAINEGNNQGEIGVGSEEGNPIIVKRSGTYTVVVTDKQGGNYTLSKATADFQIVEGWTNDAKITIVANSTEKIYDGTPLTDPKAQVFGLPDGFTINVSVTGSRTDAGESKNVVKEYNIFNSAQENVTTHFTNVTCVDGALIVAPAPLTVWTGSAEKIYDGEPLTCNEAEIRFVSNVDNTTGTDTGSQTGAGAQSESNEEGTTETAENIQRVSNIIKGIKVTATGSQTEVGSSENTYTIDWGNVNPKNFTVKEDLGMLTVKTKEVKNPTIELSPMSFVYDGQEHKPTVTVKDGETVIPSGEYDISYQKSSEVVTEIKEAGTYTVVVTDKDGGNYTLSKATAEFEIKATAVVKTDPVVMIRDLKNLVYNGKAQILVEAESTGGTLQFAVSPTRVSDVSTLTFSNTKPTATDAGEYFVYYKVVGDDHYKDLPANSLKVTISPKTVTNPTVELSPKSFEYDDQEHYPTVTVKDGTTVIPRGEYNIAYQKKTSNSSGSGDSGSGTAINEGTNQGGTEYSFTEAIKIKEAGTYTVVISDKQGGNYTLSKATADFEIVVSYKPISDNPTGKTQVYIGVRNVNPTSFIYNGYHQSPGYEVVYRFIPAESARAVMPDQDYRIKYKKNGEEVKECIQPGTYTMTVYPSDNGAFTFDPKSADFKIVFDGNIKETKDPNTGKTGGVITHGGALTLNLSGSNVVVIPQTVPGVDNSGDIPIIGIGDGAFKDATPQTTIDLTSINKVIEIGNNAVGDANVNVNKEHLADYAKNPNLETTLKNGRLFAWLSADYFLTTFSCGIDVKISQHNPTVTIHNIPLPLGSVIDDVTDYLQFYKCKVAQNWQTEAYEVVATNIIGQMKVGQPGKESLLYKANNGIIVACDSTRLIKLAEAADWSKIIDQVDWETVIKKLNLSTLPKDLGLEKEAEAMGWSTFVKLATTEESKISLVKTALNTYLSDAQNIAAIIKKVRSNAATLVAQYIDPYITIATGDAKSYGEDNMLVPVTIDSSFQNDANFTYYALFDGQFRIIANNDAKTPACKALLKVPTSLVKSGAMARSLTITKGGDETTGIRTTDVTDYTDSDAWYNLNGQRIDQPTKPGIYIYKGKKVRK